MFTTVKGARIAGIAAAVPREVEEITDYPLFDAKAAKKFSKSTGIYRRHVARAGLTATDLGYAAADRLLAALGWERAAIDLLILVTQTADYIVPASSPLLQTRLGLPKDCATIDINNGCSGWVYGLNTAAALLSQGEERTRALLVAGDTLSKICSPRDKTVYPLFGDGVTCTAIEWAADATDRMEFTLHTDGDGSDDIKILAGGARNPITAGSLVRKVYEDGVERADSELAMGGMNVFGFGITVAPRCVRELTEHFRISPTAETLYTFHQANLLMNEMIRTRLELTAEQVLNGLTDYGNTSSATIPLALVTQAAEKLRSGVVEHIACGFGVGAAWGAVHLATDRLVIPEIVEV